MINTKKDLYEYLEADKKALHRTAKHPRPNDLIWKFEINLRKAEYYHNQKKSIVNRFLEAVYKYRKSSLGLKCGFEIPLNVFGKGLSIAHKGGIVINGGAKVGDNCRIHVGVNIGTQPGAGGLAPTIGNNVYIGPGAKIFGKIYIADGIVIGANAVVTKSFNEDNICIAGVPAKKISNKGRTEIEIENKKTEEAF